MYNTLLLCGSCDIHMLYHIITLYTLTTILSIMNKNNEVYLVAFYSRTLSFFINIVINYKNLEYFFTTRILTYR